MFPSPVMLTNLLWFIHKFWCTPHYDQVAEEYVQLKTALTSIHDYWRNIALTIWTLVIKVVSLLFNMLSRFVIAFLPRSKRFNFLASVISAVILEPKSVKTVTALPPFFPHLFAMKWSDCWGWEWKSWFKPQNSSALSVIGVVLSAYLRLMKFILEILIPACASSSLAFYMMYSAHKINRVTNTALSYSFPNFEPVSCSM